MSFRNRILLHSVIVVIQAAVIVGVLWAHVEPGVPAIATRAANAASVNILLNFLTLSSVLHLHWMHFFPKQWGFATGAGSEQTAKEIAEISLLRAEVGKLSTQVELQRQGL